MIGYLDPGTASALVVGAAFLVILAIGGFIYLIVRMARRPTATQAQTQHGIVPPSWQPDPSQPGQLRWWDGTGWTDHVTRSENRPSADPVKPKP